MRGSANPLSVARRLACLLLCSCALANAPLSAQSVVAEPLSEFSSGAVEAIDLVAMRAVDFLLERVPDVSGGALWLAPFLTDTGAATRLGHRLQSAVHLSLLDHYRRTAVRALATLSPYPAATATAEVRHPAAAPPSGHALALEIQPFRDTIRIVLRLVRDGELRAGEQIDLAALPELYELLDGFATRPAEPRAARDATALARPGTADPYEPDDDPGFEVIVDLAVRTELDRVLSRGDRDRFAFMVSEATTVMVATMTELDTQLLLYREREHVPFAASGSALADGGARLELSLTAGWYVAEVVGFSDETTGDYRIVIGHGGPGLEPSALPRAPLPPTITVDQGQTRYTSGGEDWLELQVPAPGFYLLEARSFGVPLGLSLYHDRAAPPVVATRPLRTARVAQGRAESAAGRVNDAVALFAGRGVVHARIATATQLEAAYHLLLRPLTPPRRFADAAPFVLEVDHGAAFHTLRIFGAGTYAATIRDGSDGLTMRVFGVPDMELIAARSGAAGKGTTEYELAAGDYLVELVVSEPRDHLWVCWVGSGAALRCGG